MMRSSGQSPARKAVNFLVGAVVFLTTANTAIGSEPEQPRQRELIHLLVQDCGSCHGLTLKGGLGPALLPQNLATKDDEYLAEVILQGVPGTPMPPWEFEISKDEANWLVKRLKEGGINDR